MGSDATSGYLVSEWNWLRGQPAGIHCCCTLAYWWVTPLWPPPHLVIECFCVAPWMRVQEETIWGCLLHAVLLLFARQHPYLHLVSALACPLHSKTLFKVPEPSGMTPLPSNRGQHNPTAGLHWRLHLAEEDSEVDLSSRVLLSLQRLICVPSPSALQWAWCSK